MTSGPAETPEADDAAWVVIPTPFDSPALSKLVSDPQTLFRLNPKLDIREWAHLGEDRWEVSWLNHSNGKSYAGTIRITDQAPGWLVAYESGLKSSTRLQIEPGEDGHAQLRLTDDYSGLPVAERHSRLDEVDRSLQAWGEGISGYLKAWRRWSWLPPARWFLGRVWLSMRPAARRITRWIFWITLAELAVFLLLLAILVVEQQN